MRGGQLSAILSKTARLNQTGSRSVFISNAIPSVISASQMCSGFELSKMARPVVMTNRFRKQIEGSEIATRILYFGVVVPCLPYPVFRPRNTDDRGLPSQRSRGRCGSQEFEARSSS